MEPSLTVETAVTTRAISLSDDDIAALLAVRSVIADSVHPGRAAALAALAKLAAASDLRAISGCTVNVHAFADDFAEVCGCGNTTSGPPVVPPKRVMS